MRKIYCNNLEEAMVKLQEYVDGIWHCTKEYLKEGHEKREWFKATPKDSYGSKEYRVELWVLEGSPVKQIVIIHHSNKEICVFDSLLKKEAIFTWMPKY